MRKSIGILLACGLLCGGVGELFGDGGTGVAGAQVGQRGAATPAPESAKKIKIVVMTSKGGNGHISTCTTLTEIFPSYDIKLVNPIYDIFKKAFDGEDWYVRCIQKDWIRSMNFVAGDVAPCYFKMNRKSFRKRILNYLKKEKPDMLISVIPYLNYPAAWAAQQAKIPFMLITLDADLTLWLIDMERCKKYDFTITVQAKTPRIVKQLQHKKIPLSCVYEVGAPLRKDFLVPRGKTVMDGSKTVKNPIIDELGIPDNKQVLLLMRGGTGSSKLVDYVKELVKIDKPLHLLVCIARNTALGEKIKRIKADGKVSVTVVPFTKKIPDLMAVSDLLISQPSPNVCNEAIALKLPILVDMTGNCLFWEKATIDWIQLYGSGKIFKKMKDLNKLVVESLGDKEKLRTKEAKPRLDFRQEIEKLVHARLNL